MICTSKLIKQEKLNSIKVIGIIGSNEESLASFILNEIFINAGYKIEVINYNNIFKNNIKSEIRKVLCKDIDAVVLEISPDKIREVISNDFKIDILIHISMNDDLDNYNRYRDDKKSIVNSIGKDKIAIINLDDEKSISLISENKDLIVLTYGFDSKASITISSLNLDILPSLSLCLQRTIETIKGNSIEPLELPICSNMLNKENLHTILAVIGACFYYDIDSDVIVKTFKEIS